VPETKGTLGVSIDIGAAEVAIDRWVAGHREELVASLSCLVQCRSDLQPPLADERSCQEIVATEYRAAGLEVDVFGLDEVPGLATHPLTRLTWDGFERPIAGRPDVVGVLRGRGGGRSLLISSHVDTVSAISWQWTGGDPFSGRVEGDRLYGRGSWDTKWGIIAGLYTARCLLSLGVESRGDVIIESVVDEEFGGSHGALAARLRGYRADVAFNCEPTSMVVGTAHRGGTQWQIVLRGVDRGMAFGEQATTSAVGKLAATIEAISQWNQERNARRSGAFPDQTPAYILQVMGGGDSYAQAVGVPQECRLLVWAEEEPGVTEEVHRASFVEGVNDLLRLTDAFEDGVMPEYRQMFRYLPGSVTKVPCGLEQMLADAYSGIGASFVCGGVPLAADTYVFNLYSGIPALTIGPRGGNAHAADEYVHVSDVLNLVRIFSRVAMRWCA
jgi:acetylornithine deacetylase